MADEDSHNKMPKYALKNKRACKDDWYAREYPSHLLTRFSHQLELHLSYLDQYVKDIMDL